MKQTSKKMNRLSAASGQAIVLVALGMIGLLAFAVLALDGGRFYAQRRIAQNASDIASLGGLYVYVNAFSTIHDSVVWAKIVQMAQSNQIPDTDDNPDNATNDNIQAWWLNSNGQKVGEIQKDPVAVPPTDLNGVRPTGIMVEAKIPYETFIGGLVGRPNLVAQADGTSQIDWSSKPISGLNNAALWVGGQDAQGYTCNNITDRIGNNYANTNSAAFGSSTNPSNIYIDGSLTVGQVNASDFWGTVIVNGVVGVGPIDGPYSPMSPATSNPFPISGAHSNQFHVTPNYQDTSPAGAEQGVNGVSPWAILTETVHPDGTFAPLATPRQLQASDFLFPPYGIAGEMYQRYEYVYKPLGLTPPNFYHFIHGDDEPGRTAGDAARDIDTAWKAGGRGVFYVNGYMFVPNGVSNVTEWTGITIIAAGKFWTSDNNRQYDTAGPAARNISVLAGADLGTPTLRCASDRANWVFKVDGNNNRFNGILYVPNGEAFFAGNTSGGTTHYSAPVITHSIYLGSNDSNCLSGGSGTHYNASCQAQSWQFQFASSLMGDPYPATTLQH